MSKEDALFRLAYSVGFFMGDGCLSAYPDSKSGKIYHSVRFGKPDCNVLERVRDQIKDVFGKEYRVRARILKSGMQYYVMDVYSKDIFDFFAVNTCMKAALPQEYFSAPEEIRREVLRGLFDSDGHVAEFMDGSIHRWQVGFSNTNLPLVQTVASMMQRIGVKVGVISEMKKTGYRICYGVKPNIRSFIDAGLFFYSRRRQDKIDRYLAHMCAPETAPAAPVTSGEDTVHQIVKAV